MQDRIIGTTMPVLEIMLDPGEAIFSESGELSWMTQSIVMQTSTQMGGGGGVGGVVKRALGGSSIFMTEYSAQAAPGMVAFAARLPGMIDRKSTRLNSSHLVISYAVFCLKKKIQ